jgi:F0F1-type ATP synthase epsilon subunit
MKEFAVSILGPQRILFDGGAVSLKVPCESGYLEVLADHAALMANVVPGTLSLTLPDAVTRSIRLTAKGFMQVRHNAVTLLLREDLDEQA